jgi:hypothetical protein
MKGGEGIEESRKKADKKQKKHEDRQNAANAESKPATSVVKDAKKKQKGKEKAHASTSAHDREPDAESSPRPAKKPKQKHAPDVPPSPSPTARDVTQPERKKSKKRNKDGRGKWSDPGGVKITASGKKVYTGREQWKNFAKRYYEPRTSEVAAEKLERNRVDMKKSGDGGLKVFD